MLRLLSALFAVATFAVASPAQQPKGNSAKRPAADASQILSRLKLGESVLVEDGWEISASAVDGKKLINPVIKVRGRNGRLKAIIEADEGEVGEGSRKGTVPLGMRTGRTHDYRDGTKGTFEFQLYYALGLSRNR